jgi:hypothetical protein
MLKSGYKGLWRPFIGIVVAYAVAAQSLLIVLGGFSVLAQADTAAPAFELCHRDAGAPGLPTNAPGHPGCSHCIFCFAGSHHAVMGTPPGLFTRLDAAVIEVAAIPDIAERLGDQSIGLCQSFNHVNQREE